MKFCIIYIIPKRDCAVVIFTCNLWIRIHLPSIWECLLSLEIVGINFAIYIVGPNQRLPMSAWHCGLVVYLMLYNAKISSLWTTNRCIISICATPLPNWTFLQSTARILAETNSYTSRQRVSERKRSS